MKQLKNKNLTYNGERGSVILETALVVPVLLILLFGLVETGGILNTYLQMVQIAHEGAKFGSRTANLNVNFPPSNPTWYSGNPLVLDGLPSDNHSQILQRMFALSKIQASNLKLRNLVFYSSLASVGTPTSFVGVTTGIRGNYVAIFPLFDGLQITVNETASYISN